MQKPVVLPYNNKKFDEISEENKLIAGQISQQLRELTAPPEDPASIPNIQEAAQKHL